MIKPSCYVCDVCGNEISTERGMYIYKVAETQDCK